MPRVSASFSAILRVRLADEAGVFGRVATAIGAKGARDPDTIWNLTIKRNTVAVVSDGSAVLGLGDIGPGGALPVI